MSQKSAKLTLDIALFGLTILTIQQQFVKHTKPADNITMQVYHGSCHCGAIEFTFKAPEITDAMRCDCSICARKGIIMTSITIPPDAIKITVKDKAQRTYQFGTMTARHHFCGNCGIHTFVETRLNPGHSRVNLGCVDTLDALRLPQSIYDGKSL